MNIILNKKYLSLFLFLSIGACTKQLDVNLNNPNGITSANIGGGDVFANALQTTSSNITSSNTSFLNNYSFAEEWMGYLARTTTYSQSGQEAIENFKLQNSFGDGIWQSEYHNIYDYNFVINHSTTNSVLPGAAMVMQALVYQNLVDTYGNVPYTEGANPDVSTTPAYDDAAAIYKALIGKLDTAITLLKASQASGDDAADIMFKGDKGKWVRFANTVKLRILMRQVPNGDQNYVKTEIAAIISEGSGYLGAGEDATINAGYANMVSKQSPFWNSFGFEPDGVSGKNNHTFFIANKTMIDFLNSTKDPRLGYLYDTTGGKISGNYLGATVAANPVASLATIGSGVLQSPTQNAVIMEDCQSFFLQSEAAERTLIPGDYNALLKTAIEESFRYLTVPNAVATADAFFTASNDDKVNPSIGTDPLKAILYQKWVALCEVDGLEAWSEWRRTGYPDRTNPSISPTADVNMLPERLLYPQSEYNLNGKNVNAQNQGADGFYTKIFWGM